MSFREDLRKVRKKASFCVTHWTQQNGSSNTSSHRKSRQEGGSMKKTRRPVQRRMTCPSPHEISRALQSPTIPASARAASLDELIQRCLHCFDSEGKLIRGIQLVNMTLMMHNWVVPSHTFAHKLLSLYKDCPVEKRAQRRPQICQFIRHWIAHYPLMFETDPLLEEVMGDLCALVRAEKDSHCQLIDTPYPNPPADICLAPSPSVKKRKVSLLFDHMEADEIAEHLSYLEFKNFCSVSFLDYRSYMVHGSVRNNPALERSVMLCNGVSQWVQLMILNRHTPQQRAEVFTKFIHVAQKLRSLQNFNTLMAVIGGLCHSSISRLKDTASLLSSDITKALSELTELLSSYSNYTNYRRVYNECNGFKVPILGVHLKDLISLNEALPDYLEGDKINLGKLQHLYSNISDLLAIHKCKPPFEANKDLLHLLTLSLDLYYTEDEIYELSYAKEPKNPKIQPVTPVKPPVVAEWGSGVAPRLDPDTISKHVKQMVDSIMKNYDLNMDGYISLEDFEKIAANFPFSFCTHDSDREGEISREEITSYFMRGMSVCAKLGFNLHNLHNFHEMTYKRPTFCDTCRGFLWGVIKQGYHCKDCGVNCHKHCKDLVAMECMKFQVSGGSCPCTPGPGSGIRTKGNSWSSEEEAFVFPHGNGPDHSKSHSTPQSIAENASLSDRSTQTDPGVWTPVANRRDLHHSKTPSPTEKSATLPVRMRGSSAPSSFLQEKMEELQLNKDKRKEPD
ncbi:RAS guanyl-releasing protein 4 isoform X1 [Pangasianodon hypophthalmus]|uniref:RAS guanyl-releasing protein 4 isoform X1 n=1 Tax=Pangasianodon hypophthalmus TaxID=310915 RepID=UPI000EFE698E|nr:RAS guanyl-releasing protein 4 isoform X1 [Pangasianodon hypophthalmus]